jgi:pyruvate dehydrogenase E2 component (dihydrolipoamide acetyltransferase)
MEMEFKLPALGEGVDEVVIAGVPVKVGDTVAKGQTLLEVESSKAVMEIESLFAASVLRIMVKAGDKAKVGQVMMVFESEAMPAPVPVPVPKSVDESPAPKPVVPLPPPPPPPPPPAPVALPAAVQQVPEPSPLPMEEPKVMDLLIPASPTVRKMARELGVNLQKVIGSGPGGRILEKDVQEYVKKTMTQLQESEARGFEGQAPEENQGFTTPALGGSFAAPAAVFPKLPDFSEWGVVERRALNMVKRTTGQLVKQSWLLAPQVTHEDAADVTELDQARIKTAGGKRVTMTAYLVKAVVSALKTFPNFNTSLDEEFKELIQKTYFNIGIAVDTSYGLMVPVITAAEKKSVADVARELESLAQKAREHRLSLQEMQGGCFTISNLGGIGGRAFSPIINWPEVAILGVARARREFMEVGAHRDAPVQGVHGDMPVQGAPSDAPLPGAGEFRLMLPLCLTYDHRVIDGAEGARFMNKIKELLETAPYPQ